MSSPTIIAAGALVVALIVVAEAGNVKDFVCRLARRLGRKQ